MRTSVTSGKMTGPALLRAAFGAEAMLLKAPPARATAAEKESSASIGVLAWMSKRGCAFKFDSISADERAQVEELFELIDADGGGDIGMTEVMGCLRFCGLSPTQAQLEKLFVEVDADGSGRIDVDEFTTMLLDPKMLEKIDDLAATGALMPVPLWMMYVVCFGVLCFSLPSSETRHITYRTGSDKSKKCGFA